MLGLIRFAEWLKLNRSNFKDLAYFTSIMALIIDFILEVFAEKIFYIHIDKILLLLAINDPYLHKDKNK